jgi:gamma-butyrobetaine dioxygenase
MTEDLSAALAGFAPDWLRASCPCGECRDPRSGQRLVSITDLPDRAALAAVTEAETEAGDGVAVTFSPDGHRAVFDRAWLAGQADPALDDRTEDGKRFWTGTGLAGGAPVYEYPDYQAEPATRADALATLLALGFIVLRGVAPEPGAVLEVAGGLGFVRETNYGRLFDVRVSATPANLAYTGLPIPLHTDNPYRDPVPTVQLLHCLASDVAGGDSAVADGFAAAARLRAADPAAFGLLAGTPVTFAYADATAELRATRPMIGLDPAGRIREIRFNNRSLQPWRPRPGEPDPAAAGAAFYAAYRAFARLLLEPELTFRLEPGDCLVLDNTRVLHARTGFAAAGGRHLQGCYADLDGVASTVALLRRTA